MILVVKAGTDLNTAGEIEMFIAEDVPTALEEWEACFNHHGQIDELCSPVPKYVDVYTVTPFMDDIEAKQ